MKLILILLLIFLPVTAHSQVWQQTATTPEGAGVTDLIVREFNQHIFLTTASFNWPNGDMGGVRRSTNDGDTWENLNDVYIARTIVDAPDGNLYASIWPFPSPEGLYRSIDNGDNWGIALVTVPTGDNIFSIALNITTSPNTIFAGTRNGPLRSTDNGVSWVPAVNGIPSNSWVRDIEVDSVGVVVAATTNGLFTSTNNGDVWQQATGIAAADTIVKIAFDYPPETDQLAEQTRLIAGSDDGNLYEAFGESEYLTYTLALVLGGGEISGIARLVLRQLNQERWGVTEFPKNETGGGFSISSDNAVTFMQNNQGLPVNPNISALAGYSNKAGTSGDFKFYVGAFNNTNGGSKIYKINYSVSDVEQIFSLLPDKYQLNQNYPNPFNPSTKIEYSIPAPSHVQLKVYNILGIEVATLVNQEQTTGIYRADLNGNDLASGLYIAQLIAGNYIQTIKMTLVK